MSEPHNPYRAPAAMVNDVQAPVGAPVKAVLYGVLVDVGGSIGVGLLLGMAYSLVLAASGASLQEMQRRLTEPDPLSWISLAGLAIGFGASLLGGYVCARVAAVSEMRPVGIVAAVSGIVSLLMGSGAYAFEWNAVMALAGMATVFVGGRLGARSNRRRAA
jgi:hypothetical protein